MNWFMNLKISVKLILGFLVVAGITGIVGITGITNIKTIDELDTKLYETMTVPLGEMLLFVEGYQTMRGNLRDILLTNNQTEIADYEETIKKRNMQFTTNLDSYEKTLFTDRGKELVNNIREAKAKYDLLAIEVIKLSKANQKEEALKLLHEKGNPLRIIIEGAYEEMVKIKVDTAKETSESNSDTADTAITTMITFIIIGMMFAIGLGIYISKIISNPINEVVKSARKLADGDLNIELNNASKDEIGMLAVSFNQMTDNINSLLSNITVTSEQVAAGSKQVSEGSQVLSQGATEQASSIEELTASITQIASQTRQNAENANKANELATNAKDNAVKGNKQMKDMVNAMSEISDSSSNISKIIKVIDEIAFQTNILALNAAVEAARAGQHGKGFAVVAEEVRNLAARSANAAKETTTMIEGSIKKVGDGTKMANDTSNALDEIVKGVEKAANLVADIASASNEQATGISQINKGIEQVSQVIQSNSATAEESASASEELSSQAEILMELVSKFKLKRNTSYSGQSDYDRVNGAIAKQASNINNTEKKLAKKKISLGADDFGKY